MLFWVRERELAEVLDVLSSESTFSAILSNGESIYSSLELQPGEQTRELWAAVSDNASHFRMPTAGMPTTMTISAWPSALICLPALTISK